MAHKKLAELLSIVNFYYPIGAPDLYEFYAGYQNLRAIIEKKINQLIQKEENEWTSLVRAAQIEIKRDIRNESHHQFPNYKLSLVTGGANPAPHIRIERSIQLIVSLLTNHYTWFIREDTFFRFVDLDPKTKGGVVSILHSKATPDEDNCVAILEKLIALHYPNYSPLHHKLLLDFKIRGGVPHGEAWTAAKQEYSIFEFLFDSLSLPEQFLVLD